MSRRALTISGLATATVSAALALTTDAEAQPYPPQPYPPYAQPYPQQPYPQQPPPAYPQQQPYPQQPPPYPQQPYPQQPYPPPYPPPYPQQPGYYPPPPPPPPQNDRRSSGEMVFLYVTGGLYGVGSGIWIDALGKIKDPGAAVIAPLALGAAVPIGVYFWDSQGGPLHRGVPSSIATGLVLGGVEGIAIAGTQWQYTHEKDKDWSFATQTTVTWIMATGGAVGGWAFGEWLRPDPRSLGFIGGTSAWGAVSGSLLGIAVSGKDWKDSASVAGLIGYNLGILGGGAVAVIHTPSWTAQKYMWMGYGAGALVGCLVFPFYLFVDDADAKRGFIGPAIGGVAGAGLAAALTFDMKDPEDTQRPARFKPPFDVAIMPPPALTPPTANATYSARSIAEMVGPNPALGTTSDGATVNVLGTF